MAGGTTNLGTLFINLKVKDEATKQLDKASSKVESIGKKAKKTGDKFTKNLTLPLVGFGSLAIREFAGFEQSLAKVQAVTGASGDDMDILSNKAREMGKNTKFSASEAAEAMNFMGMAGWDTTQIMDGLDGVMNLAAATGTDLATTSDIVTDALTAFGMKASDTNSFVDLLANTSRNANTDVVGLGEAFKYCAPVAGSLGITAEDTAMALGLMANAGIKAGSAGTVLRGALTRLVKPTGASAAVMKKYGIELVKNADGSVNLKGSMDLLRNTMGKMDKTQQAQVATQIFGKEAMSGMLAIINASDDDYKKLTKSTREYNGAAKEMSDIMEDTVQGKLAKMKSAFSELLIVVGEKLVPVFTMLIEKLTDMINWFSSLDDGTQEFILKVGLLAAAIGPLLSIFARLMIVGGGVAKLFTTTAVAATTTTTAVAGTTTATGLLKGALALLNPVVLGVAAGAGLMIAGFKAYKDSVEKNALPSSDQFISKLSEISEEAGKTASEVRDLVKDHAKFIIDIELGQNKEETSAKMKEVLDGVSTVKRDHEVRELEEQRKGLEIASNMAEGNRKIELEKEITSINKKIEEKKKGFDKEVAEHNKKAEKVAAGEAEWNAKEMEAFNQHQIDLINEKIKSSEAYQEAIATGGAETQKLIDAIYAEEFGATLKHLTDTEEERKIKAEESYLNRIEAIEKNKTLTAEEKEKAILQEQETYALFEGNQKLHHEAKLNALREHLGDEFDLFSLSTGQMLTAQQQNDAVAVEMNRLKNESILTGNQIHYERLGKEILSFTTSEKKSMEDATTKIKAEFEKKKASGQMSYDELRDYSSNLQKTVDAERKKIATANAAIKTSYMTEFRQSGLSMAEFEARYGTLDSAVKGNKNFIVDANGQVRKSFTKEYTESIRKLEDLGYSYDTTTGKITDSSGKMVADNVSAKDAVAALGKDGKLDLDKLAKSFTNMGTDSKSANDKTGSSSDTAKSKISGLKGEIDGYNKTTIKPKTATINVQVNGARQAQNVLNNIKPPAGAPPVGRTVGDVKESGIARTGDLGTYTMLDNRLSFTQQNMLNVEMQGVENKLTVIAGLITDFTKVVIDKDMQAKQELNFDLKVENNKEIDIEELMDKISFELRR